MFCVCVCALYVVLVDIIIIINTINMEHWTEIDFRCARCSNDFGFHAVLTLEHERHRRTHWQWMSLYGIALCVSLSARSFSVAIRESCWRGHIKWYTIPLPHYNHWANPAESSELNWVGTQFQLTRTQKKIQFCSLYTGSGGAPEMLHYDRVQSAQNLLTLRFGARTVDRAMLFDWNMILVLVDDHSDGCDQVRFGAKNWFQRLV